MEKGKGKSQHITENRSSLTLLVILIVFVISSCGENTPYPIQESGVKPGVSSVYWLDNERVLFSGLPKASSNLVNPKWVGVHGLYIWNINKQSVELYKKGRGHVCYHDGYIVYGADMDNAAKQKYREKYGSEARYPYWEGMMGEETYRSYQNNYLGEKKGPNLWRSQISCRLYPVPDEPEGRTLLLDEGKYIDRSGTHNGKRSYVFHVEKKGIQKDLPMSPNMILPTKFYEFNGRYFLDTAFPASKTEPCQTYSQCAPVWWIDREGNTEKILLPLNKKKLVWDMVVPVRTGYLLIQHAPAPLGGGYVVLPNKRIINFLKGHISNPAVSPDGCKVAFNHQRPDKGSNWYIGFMRSLIASPKAKDTKLKIIYFCSKK